MDSPALDYLWIDDLQIHPMAGSWLRTFRGLGSPAPRQVISLHASRHGAMDSTRYYDGRVLELEGQVMDSGGDPAVTWQTFDQLKGKLSLGASRTLRFLRTGLTQDEMIVATVAQVVDQQITTDQGPVINWAASLFAGDPRIYSATVRSGDYDPSASLAGGGINFPLTFPLTFTTTTATQLELVNGGQFATPPVLTIQGPVGNPIVDNDTLGQSIYINFTLGSSDQVVVDVAKRTVTLNGASRVDLFDASKSSWWEMPPGTNRIRLRGSGTVTNQTHLSVAYRDASI